MWLPNLGSFLTSNSQFSHSQIPAVISVPADGSPTTVITEVTLDSVVNQEGPGGTIDFSSNLGNLIANEYFLRRIVGNIFVGFDAQRESDGDPSQAQAVQVGAGLFIARAASETTDGTGSTPVESATETERWNNYGPFALGTIREPWIWRRQWILGNPAHRARFEAVAAAASANLATASNQVGGGYMFPSTNVEYSMGADAHIDQKTLRRVGNDNRLWLAISAHNLALAEAVQSFGAIVRLWTFADLRMLGQLRRAKNRGSF